EYAATTRVPGEIRINEGSGSRRAPTHGVAQVRFAGQKNVEFDFAAPDIASVTDLRVSVPAQFNVKTALLFVRHRFYAQDLERRSPAGQQIDTSLRANQSSRMHEEMDPVAVRGDDASGLFRSPLQARPDVSRNSWTPRDERAPAPEPRSVVESPVSPPRRRRLE